ncbi:hypothetical protein AB0H98_08080 [Nocardia salmonicida]|uniref:hypothetical protein n=1 Tax=Nocardia TaxID=1817 RepID=UPI0012E7C4AF|nr:hypothetical protein [Nocardia sp. Root136]
MTYSRNRTPSTPSMDLTSTTIMLATCVFFLFGLTALTGSLPAAIFGAVSLAAGMMMTSRMLGL